MAAKKIDEADAALSEALSKLDDMSRSLDSLKVRFNEAAKGLSEVEKATRARASKQLPLPAIPETPAIAFIPPLAPPKLPGPKPSGRYSMTSEVQEEVPRSPRRTRSGRYYIELSDIGNSDEMNRLREEVSRCGRVVDSGKGTAEDPEKDWMEVAVRAEDTGTFVIKLEELEVKDKVKKLVPVAPGEGRLHARQLDLFPEKKKKSDAGR